MNLDDLELELRRLPGVIATAFDVRSDMLVVQLHVAGDRARDLPPGEASQIASRHADRPIAVELVRRPARNGSQQRGARAETAQPDAPSPQPAPIAVSAPSGSRPRLLAVLSFPERDELEVHLVHEGRRTVGRAVASHGIAAAVDATIDALRALGASFDAHTRWCRAIEGGARDSVLVAVALDEHEGATTYGLAGGDTEIDAAARSTLDAVNRRVVRLV